MLKRIEPVVLESRHVRLEPLTVDHTSALCEVGLALELWQWSPECIDTREKMAAYVERALEGQRAGTMLPFATVELSTGRVVGSTRFGNFVPAHRRVEIGWTWIAPAWQRTKINAEASYLQLRHAFEELGCVRVEFKTDAHNDRSRRAILRLGAWEEGTLRKHMVVESGRLRDTVYFSVLDNEWPAVAERLERRLGIPRE